VTTRRLRAGLRRAAGSATKQLEANFLVPAGLMVGTQ
jgi:hypothetical protein